MATVVEGGHYAIHQACRHNNLFVLELLMSRGVSVEHLDQSGNSPLHFAARYGHHDLCKFLVDRGAFAGRKNASGQTPYDVAHSHVVRQYLLPLQFQSERAEQPAAAAHGYNSYTSIGDVGAGSTGGYPPIGVPRVGSNDPQNPPAPFVGRSPAVAVVPEAELPTVPHRPHSPKAQQQQHQPAVPIGLVSTSSPPPAVTAAGTAAAGGAAAAGAAAAAVAVAPLPAAALLAQSPAGGPIAVNVGGPPTGPPVATAPLRQGIPAGGPLVGAPAVYAAPPSLPRATGGIPSSSYAEPAAPLAPGPPAFDANRRPQTNSRMIMPGEGPLLAFSHFHTFITCSVVANSVAWHRRLPLVCIGPGAAEEIRPRKAHHQHRPAAHRDAGWPRPQQRPRGCWRCRAGDWRAAPVQHVLRRRAAGGFQPLRAVQPVRTQPRGLRCASGVRAAAARRHHRRRRRPPCDCGCVWTPAWARRANIQRGEQQWRGGGSSWGRTARTCCRFTSAHASRHPAAAATATAAAAAARLPLGTAAADKRVRPGDRHRRDNAEQFFIKRVVSQSKAY